MIKAEEASAVLEAAGGQAAETFAVDDGGPVLYVAASHQSECIPVSHCLGDVITSVHSAWLWVREYRPSRVILSLCRDEAWNPLWARFVRENRAAVVWDPKAKEKSETYALFDDRRRTRQVEGRPFDIYRETYVRTDGGPRQTALCGSEVGLVERERPLTIFTYNWYGQENESRPFPARNAGFGPGVIDVPEVTRSCRVLVSPYAKCMGMDVFTWDLWRELTGRLLEAGLPVTLNHSHDLWDLRHPLLERRFSTPESIADYVAGHALVVCGNTGVGWVAAATGTPLLAVQPRDGWMFQDFRYENAGIPSLLGIVEEADPAMVAGRAVDWVQGRRLR